jgi:hypothetical protein
MASPIIKEEHPIIPPTHVPEPSLDYITKLVLTQTIATLTQDPHLADLQFDVAKWAIFEERTINLPEEHLQCHEKKLAAERLLGEYEKKLKVKQAEELKEKQAEEIKGMFILPSSKSD